MLEWPSGKGVSWRKKQHAATPSEPTSRLQGTVQRQCGIEQSPVHKSRGAVTPGQPKRWQLGSRTQFINVTTAAAAAERLGYQRGSNRSSDTTVFWQWDSQGRSNVAAAPSVQCQLGTGLVARRCVGSVAQKPTDSHPFSPPVLQHWPSWHL